MSTVVQLGGYTKGRVPPEHMAENTDWEAVQDVVFVGWHTDGTFKLASSTGELGEILHLLELAKKQLMEEAYG